MLSVLSARLFYHMSSQAETRVLSDYFNAIGAVRENVEECKKTTAVKMKQRNC